MGDFPTPNEPTAAGRTTEVGGLLAAAGGATVVDCAVPDRAVLVCAVLDRELFDPAAAG